MRLLYLSLAPPVPATNGYALRTWSILRALAGEGHEVILLTFGDAAAPCPGHESLRAVCADVEVCPMEWASLTAGHDYLRRLGALLLPRPYAVERFVSTEMRERVARHLARQSFDAVLCDTYARVNVSPEAPPVILVNQNVESMILHRYARREPNPLKRIYALLELRKLRAWERQVCRDAAINLVCSETDRDVLGALCGSVRIAIVPNVVDLPPRDRLPPGDDVTVLFQGGLDWYPNRQAVEFFVQKIWPRLRSLAPSAQFLVAGRNPSPRFLRRFEGVPGITFTGTVRDMTSVVARAALSVVPLLIGSGTRLKILEAAAMGKPIVSTPLGAEGLRFVDGEDIVLAEEPRAFAHAVAELLADGARRARLGAAARRRVAREYSFPVLRSALREGLARAIPCGASPSELDLR